MAGSAGPDENLAGGASVADSTSPSADTFSQRGPWSIRVPGIEHPSHARDLVGVWLHDGEWVVATQRREGRTERLQTWRAPVQPDEVATAVEVDRHEWISTRATAPRLVARLDGGAWWIKPADNLEHPDALTTPLFVREIRADGRIDSDSVRIEADGVRLGDTWGVASVGWAALVCMTGARTEVPGPVADSDADVWCFRVDDDQDASVQPSRVLAAAGPGAAVRSLHVGGGEEAGFVAAIVRRGDQSFFTGAHVSLGDAELDVQVADDLLGQPVPVWGDPRSGPWSWSSAGGSWWVVGGWGRFDEPSSIPARAGHVSPGGDVLARRQVPPPASFMDRPMMVPGAAGPWFVYDDYDAQGRRGIVGFSDDAVRPGVATPPIGVDARSGQARNGVVSGPWVSFAHLGPEGETLVTVTRALAFGDPWYASALITDDLQ